jgi:FkbM family methyltransferase
VTLISYAQAKEDIHLFRALSGVDHDVGFYIDVGAWDPEIDSVTKLFYDRGWRGINVEPSPKWFARLAERRPRDINLQAAVSDVPGEIAYYEHTDGGLGTTVERIADRHVADGRLRKKTLTVKTLTLTQICGDYAPKDIHFLKIDVEGSERSVLNSMDFQKYRPWILCIESHFPMKHHVQTYCEWEGYVLDAGYQFVYTDRVNRYYVAHEHRERAVSFACPADFYIHINDVRRVETLEKRIQFLEASEPQPAAYWTDGARRYSAAAFRSDFLPASHPFLFETDFSVTDTCVVSGPYVRLPPGEHEATFHVKAIGLGDQQLASPIVFDVARDMARIASVEAFGSNGAHLLRNEQIKVQFRNADPGSLYEFRIFTTRRPFDGSLAFFGVTLRGL